MKKTLLLLLSLVMLLCFASCGKTGDAPTGFRLASDAELCDYVLYVPEAWVSESNQSNYTITTVSNADTCSLSVAKLENVYEPTMAEYWDKCKTEYAFLQNFTVLPGGTDENGQPVEWAKATVGTGESARNGYRYVFTGDYNGVSYKYQQIFLVKNGLFGSDLYCITYAATADHYDNHLETVNAILGYFAFR